MYFQPRALSFHVKRGRIARRSYIKKHRLAFALKADIESVDRLEVLLAALRNQGFRAALIFKAGENRAFRIGRRLVRKIHSRVQTEIDAAGDKPEGDMRGHRPAVDKGNAAGLDRLEAVLAGFEIGRLAPEAGEIRIGLAALLLRRIVESGRVGLPDFDQSVLERRAPAVDHMADDRYALALGAARNHRLAEVLWIDARDAREVRRRADMDIGPRGLGGRLLEMVEPLRHHAPSFLFSKGVERRPRSTMSNL